MQFWCSVSQIAPSLFRMFYYLLLSNGVASSEIFLLTTSLRCCVFFIKNLPCSLYFLRINLAVDNRMFNLFEVLLKDLPSSKTLLTSCSRFFVIKVVPWWRCKSIFSWRTSDYWMFAWNKLIYEFFIYIIKGKGLCYLVGMYFMERQSLKIWPKWLEFYIYASFLKYWKSLQPSPDNKHHPSLSCLLGMCKYLKGPSFILALRVL